MISLIIAAAGATLALVGLALSVRSLVLVLRVQRTMKAAPERTSFKDLLAQAERERLAQQAEAERDDIPWR